MLTRGPAVTTLINVARDNDAVVRCVVLPYPAWGHVNPARVLVRELVSGGDEVLVVTPPRFAGGFRAGGARVRYPAATPDVHVAGSVTVRSALRAVKGAVRRLFAVVAVVAATPRRGVDVILVDALWGLPTWVFRGTRVAVLSTTYAVTTTMSARWSRHGLARPVVPGWWRPYARRITGAGLVLVNAQPALQPSPADLPPGVRLVGPLLDPPGHRPDDPVIRWLAGRDGPVLFVSPGTVFAREPAFYRRVVRAFTDTDWSVVIATGTPPPALGPLPDNVTVRSRVPQTAVLDRADVFLTHAGMNSAQEAIRARVPMIVAPRARDQWFIARRLVESGVAVTLPHPATGPRGLREAATRLAGDHAVRDRLRRWDTPGCPQRTAARLLREFGHPGSR